MKNQQLRQGDVFLIPLEDFNPETTDAVKVEPKDGLVILAHGEVTGHMHAVTANNADMFRDGLGAILFLKNDAVLKHGNPMKAWAGDHADVKLPGRTAYRVIIQREYEPNGWRQVVD